MNIALNMQNNIISEFSIYYSLLLCIIDCVEKNGWNYRKRDLSNKLIYLLRFISVLHSVNFSSRDLQDQKNSWQSAEELRKYKDNREKQNSVWKQRIDEPKCNIQKESKMMGVAGQPPIITHTAATPQDSPNTTLDVGYRDLNCRAVYPAAALSIESIDRSGVRCFSSIKKTLRHYAQEEVSITRLI